jgi:aspartyl-tRNA(Asn)/glutamyl-tRNA(Gln) amidotransferase subunit C
MKLTPSVIQHLAHLARLNLSQEEAQELQGELQKIIDSTQHLPEVGSETNNELPSLTWLRDDTARLSGTTEELLNQGPALEDSFFLVPRTLRKRGL